MDTNRNTINIVQLISPVSAIQTTVRIAKIIGEAQEIEEKLATIEKRDIESVSSHSKVGVMAAGCTLDLTYLAVLSQGVSYFISGQTFVGTISVAGAVFSKMYCQVIINGGEEHEVKKLDLLRKVYNNHLRPEKQ